VQDAPLPYSSDCKVRHKRASSSLSIPLVPTWSCGVELLLKIRPARNELQIIRGNLRVKHTYTSAIEGERDLGAKTESESPVVHATWLSTATPKRCTIVGEWCSAVSASEPRGSQQCKDPEGASRGQHELIARAHSSGGSPLSPSPPQCNISDF